MQRAAWPWRSAAGYGRYTSRQSCSRSATGRVGCLWRWISMNPVALPMHDLELREHDQTAGNQTGNAAAGTGSGSAGQGGANGLASANGLAGVNASVTTGANQPT